MFRLETGKRILFEGCYWISSEKDMPQHFLYVSLCYTFSAVSVQTILLSCCKHIPFCCFCALMHMHIWMREIIVYRISLLYPIHVSIFFIWDILVFFVVIVFIIISLIIISYNSFWCHSFWFEFITIEHVVCVVLATNSL